MTWQILLLRGKEGHALRIREWKRASLSACLHKLPEANQEI